MRQSAIWSRIRVRRAQLLVMVASASVACSSSNGPGVPDHGTSVLLTDTPFPYDLVSRADVFVVDVRAGTDSGTTGSACGNATQIVAPNRSFDLLALQRGTTALLGEAQLPAGQYRSVCITINTDLSSLTLRDGRQLTGSTSPKVDWSGAGERIIKADIFEPIPVADTGGTILIHFDVGRSFIPLQDVEPPRADSGFAFVAIVDAFNPAGTGSISGTLVGGTGRTPIPNASLRVFVGDSGNPENTWFVVATGTSDPSGHFKLAFLTPSSYWPGSGYILGADAPATTPYGPFRLSGVDVTAGAETSVGEVLLP
jgi:uncharacterized protein DUF4382